MTRLHVTEVGRRVALTGLLPETGRFLLAYAAERVGDLLPMLPDASGQGGDTAGLNFCLLSAALMAPEFSGLSRTRAIPFGFDVPERNPHVDRFAPLLAERPWQPYRGAVNAAALLMEWIDGAPLAALEGRFQAVRAGTVESLCREVVWCLSGFADILAVVTRADLDPVERPHPLRGTTGRTLLDIRRILPSLRLLVRRLNTGLPEGALWLLEARGDDGRHLVSRREALALHRQGLASYDALRQRNNWSSVVGALRAEGVPEAQSRAQLIQQLAHDWHLALRDKARTRQAKRLGSEGAALLGAYYNSRDRQFEHALEELLRRAGVGFTRFDDGRRQAAFDYLLHAEGRRDLPLECKAKQGNGLVALNEATDVLRATELHGHAGANCVTLCQPGVDPNVPAALLGCARLCIVEAHDMADALVQVALSLASPQDLLDWLSQPGQAKPETFASSRLALSEHND